MPFSLAAFQHRFISAPDGLSLHFRDYGSALDPALPVVCLPGLTRSAADFGPLATALSAGLAGAKRRVLALDYRGRGLSGYDQKWENYSLPVENADILAVLDATGIERAILVGTSRGGLHAMLMTATRPDAIAGVVLNDIGPVLDSRGLARIKSYVGKQPAPSSEGEAIELLKKAMGSQFTHLAETDWAAWARISFANEAGQYGLLYDRNLGKAFEDFDLEKPTPSMWEQFEGLRDAPLLIVHGGNSDLLNAETVAEMKRRHPGAEVHVVEDQGHAPLLIDAPTIARIAAFVAAVPNA